MWFGFAVGSAFFAGITSILAKCGIKKTDSDVATAIRTIVVLIFAWLMVAVTGTGSAIAGIEMKTMVFLILSGIATGASWLCYFKALQLGDVNKVVPIDKSSTVLTILLAFLILREEIRLCFCQPYVYFRKNRHIRGRFQSWNGYPHDCSTFYGVAGGVREGETAGSKEGGVKGTAVYYPVGLRDRRIVVVLLQSAADGPRKCRRADR